MDHKEQMKFFYEIFDASPEFTNYALPELNIIPNFP
jgi:hypothetical protein